MTHDEFEKIAEQAIKEIPPEIQSQIDNVEIVIEDWPSEEQTQGNDKFSLLGLYEGIPKTERENYSSIPDRIILFREPILYAASFEKDAEKIIKDTVLHELGHHLGLSDEELRAANV
jgi:predicted Zn-dependent protease with MMP-like domain